jgi:hypothetical protein
MFILSLCEFGYESRAWTASVFPETVQVVEEGFRTFPLSPVAFRRACCCLLVGFVYFDVIWMQLAVAVASASLGTGKKRGRGGASTSDGTVRVSRRDQADAYAESRRQQLLEALAHAPFRQSSVGSVVFAGALSPSPDLHPLTVVCVCIQIC